MNTRIIINPAAGAGQARANTDSVRTFLANAWGKIEWLESHNAKHVTELAAQAAQFGYERVIVAGGDGSVHCAANGVVGTQTALGILPVGTNNEIATIVGLPADIGQAAKILTQGHIHRFDVGQVDNFIFCSVLGMGLDTPLLQRLNATTMRHSRLFYSWVGLRTLLSYTPNQVSIDSDDLHFNGPVLFVAVANMRSYTGKLRITPTARVDDGLLDICILPAMRWWRAISTYRHILHGTHGQLPEIILAKATSVQIRSAQLLPLTLDGELTTLTTPVTIKILPRALRLLGI